MHPLCCQENFDDFGIAKIPALCLSHDAYAIGLKCEYMRAGRSPNSVVACYSIEGILIKIYPTAKRAALSLHHHPRTIDKAIRENKVIHNRIWRRFPDGEVPEKVEPFYKPTITYNPKPIGLLDDNNNVIKAYPSVRSAAIDNEVDAHTIRDMLYRKTKTAHGKRYRYLSEEEALRFGIVISHDFDRVRIRQYSLSGKLIKIHDSYKDAAITVGVDKSAISYCVNKGGKTVKDFYWIRDDEHAEEKLAELMARKRFFYTAIVQFDKKGKEVARYKSAKEAEKARINDFIAKNYEKTKISENLQEFQTKIDELNDKKAAILELPIDDEKKNELCADIDLELDSLNLQLGREKSRKVMEFTTTDELSEKCRILKNDDLDPTDTSVVKSLFESLAIKGKQEMWIVMRGTNMAFNDESIKMVQFMHPFASGEFTYIKKKVAPVKTKWHLIIY